MHGPIPRGRQDPSPAFLPEWINGWGRWHVSTVDTDTSTQYSVVVTIANGNESTEYSRISPVPTKSPEISQPARNLLPLDSHFGP